MGPVDKALLCVVFRMIESDNKKSFVVDDMNSDIDD
jgi:hypothetical protein